MADPFFYIALYIGLIYLRPHEFWEAISTLPILPATLVLAFVLWLIRGRKNLQAPQFLLFALLILTMMLSSALNGWAGGAVQIFHDFYPVMLLYIVLATSVNNPSRLRTIISVIAAVTIVIAIHGIGQRETGIGWSGAKVAEGNRITYLGFLNDPNDLGVAFLMALPFTSYLWRTSKTWYYRWTWFAGSCLIVYAIYLTNSRGAILGLAFLLGLFFVQRRGLFAAILVGALLLPFGLLLPSRLGTIDAQEESAAGRIEAWYEGHQMFFENPFFGVGKGNFTEYHTLTAHNSFILVYSELGLVGYFLWLSFIALSIYMLWSIHTHTPPKTTEGILPEADNWLKTKAMANTLLFTWAGFLIPSFFLSRSYLILLFILSALSVGLYQYARSLSPSLPTVNVASHTGRLIILEMASIIFLYLLTKILLLMS